MRRALALAGVLVVGAALARTLTLSPAVDVHKVELARTDDGGVELTVYGRTSELPDGGGVVVDRSHTCALTDLTAGQRTCLQTIKTGALNCWNSAEGL